MLENGGQDYEKRWEKSNGIRCNTLEGQKALRVRLNNEEERTRKSKDSEEGVSERT